MVERIRKQDDRRVALITLTPAGQKLGQTIPDPIEKKFINQLADIKPKHLQILARTMNQFLILIDTKGAEETSLEIDL